MRNIKKIVNMRNIIEVLLMIFLYAVLDNVSGIRKYAIVLVICMFFFFLGRKKTWSPAIMMCMMIPAVIYIGMGTLATLCSVNAQMTSFKVILYWITPLMFAFSLYTFYGTGMEHIVDVQFLGSILGYAIFDAPYFAKIFHWESIYAFVFGIFVVYYLYNKKWKLSVIAILFMIFAEKRIALLAVVGALSVMAVVWIFQYNRKLIYGIWGLVSAVICGYIYLITSGTMEAFCWGANINTNGRVEMYSRVAQEFPIKLFGYGLGIVEQMLEYWNVSVYSNLHNDLLKIFIELGVVGFIAFLLCFAVVFFCAGKIVEESKICYLLGIAIYTMLLFATDNVSIYMIYLIPMYSTIFSVLTLERNHNVKKDNK